MITSKEFQNPYIELYKAMREYIWEYKTVEYLAELEIAIFNAFPDIQEIRNAFNRLYLDIRDVLDEDEEFKQAVEEFKKVIEEDHQIYVKIDKVSEVNQ